MNTTMDKPVSKKSLEALRERAAAEGLLDVAYATADSPFGALLLAKTPRGLVRLGLPGEDTEAMLADLAGRASSRTRPASTRSGVSSTTTSPAAATPSSCRSTGNCRAASSSAPARASPRSPTARPAPTPTSPAPPATSARSVPPARPARATRSRWWSRVIGSCAATAASAATRAGSR